MNESDIDDAFKQIYSTITLNIKKYFGKDSSWIIHSDIDHAINISRQKPLSGSRYIKLLDELDCPEKG